MAKKTATDEGVVRYVAPALPTMPKLPAHLEVRILVDRPDGGDLTAEDIAAAEAAFPLTAPKKSAPKAKKATAKKTTTTKRSAAKKPARARA